MTDQAELFAWDCSERQLDAKSVLVYSHASGGKAVFAPETLQILRACDRFQTIDRHLAAICERDPGLKSGIAELRRALLQSVDTGLMAKSGEVLQRIKLVPGAHAAPRDPLTLTIATCYRPTELARLLNSLQVYLAGGYFDRIWVVDCSRLSGNADRNCQITQQFALSSLLPVHYFGAQQQAGLVDELILARPDLEAPIRFLLDYRFNAGLRTYGLTKNLCQLLSAGRRQILIDDDSLLQPYTSPRPLEQLKIFSGQREAHFFSSRDQWEVFRSEGDIDPFRQIHADLGSGLDTFLTGTRGVALEDASLQGATATELHTINRQSPIMSTACGYFGDPGMGGTNSWLLGLPTASLQHLFSSEQTYRAGLLAENCWRGSAGYRVVPEFDMSCIAGLDNRQVLPPYFPFNRQEDRLFGKMLKFLYGNSVSLEYPWAVPNLNPRPSRVAVSALDASPDLSFPLFDTERLSMLPRCETVVGQRGGMASLALYYEELASTPNQDILGRYRDSLTASRIAHINHITDLQRRFPGAPAHWKTLLQQTLLRYQQALQGQVNERSVEHTGLPASGGALIEFYQRSWQLFGKSLSAWSDIRSLAQEYLRHQM